MKTNKSRRIKRRSRFRNTRSKRKSVKRQRGGDQNEVDEKFDNLLKQVYELPKGRDEINITFEFKSSKFSGSIERYRSNQLYIDQILPMNDKNREKLLSTFGHGGGFITIQKPSSYWSKRDANEIINSIEVGNSQPVQDEYVEFYR
jgi:hypothetical protein